MITKQYKRCCPICSGEIFYINTSALNKANKYNTKCRKCCKRGIKSPFINKTYEDIYGKKLAKILKNKLSKSHIGIKHSKESKEKISKNNARYFLGKTFTIEHIEKLCANSGMRGTNFSNIWIEKYGKEEADKRLKERSNKLSIKQKGIPLSEEHKKKLSIAKKGKKRKLFSEEAKRKMRLSAIKRIEKNKLDGRQLIPSYNPISIPIIEEYGRANGYNFQHAENSGEYFIEDLGYWVDGYDKIRNTVIEYYERAHKNKVNRDESRKQEIVSLLNCKFIELREWEISDALP